MKKLSSMLVVSSMLLSVGCASILNEDTQKVNVMSTSGAKFEGKVDGIPFTAPGVVSVKRANMDRVITTDDPNCASQTSMSKTIDPVFFVNILSGGVFGSTTDYSTEKMWKYQDSITISCK